MLPKILAVCGVALAGVAVFNALDHDLHRTLFHGLLALAFLGGAGLAKRSAKRSSGGS